MGEPPSGTVTFVFTDIAGSTKLLRELGPDAYAESLAEHRRVVREAFSAGVEVDTQGDSFFYAFARAADALEACDRALRALAGGRVRIRAGVHTGEPLLTDEGYVGVDVHRAARIAAVGHGGQVVVSQSTRDLVPNEDLFDLGDHRLKDLSHPERLYQLGRDEFPPLRSLNLVNLPPQPTPLIGRAAELAAIVGLVREGARVVTLTGPGGSGKTRLALQVAAELTDDFPDGVWFVPLQALERAELIPFAVSSVLGCEGAPAAWLSTRKALLVVDNLEHLLPAAANAVADLLVGEGVRILATSRERLALASEHEVPIDPLEVEDGVELFLTRARQLGVELASSSSIGDVVRAVDALPLAIELAASRTKLMAVEEIRTRLHAPFELLRGGPRDAPTRQQTLRATIEWSVQLLTDDERLAFAGLGVFHGGFDVGAAELALETSIDVLAALVDKNLLRRTADGRLFMLDTVQQYARELFAQASARHEIERRHALLTRGRVLEAQANDGTFWRRLVARDYAEVRAALGWLDENRLSAEFVELVLALRGFWDPREPAEGRLWFERALGHVPDSSADACALICALGHVAFRQGDWPAATAWAEDTIARAEALGDFATSAFGHAMCGTIAWFTGDTRRAVREHELGLRLARGADDLRIVGSCTNDLALLAFAEGRVEEAERYARETVAVGRATANAILESCGLGILADVRCAEGKLAEARPLAYEALHLQQGSDAYPLLLTESFVRLAYLRLPEDPEHAGLLLGARDEFVTHSGMAIEPTCVEMRDRVVEELRNLLGPEGTREALDRGARMTLEAVADLALEHVRLKSPVGR